jgi:transcriptional regulator of acetoin/glycerol metabolism
MGEPRAGGRIDDPDRECHLRRRMLEETLESSREQPGKSSRARPGVIATFSAGATSWVVLPVPSSGLVVGRAPLPADPRLSREHAAISRTADGWRIRDLDSRNGTFVDGHAVHGTVTVPAPRVVRLADSIFIPVDDVDAFVPPRLERDMVVGPTLARALDAVARAAEHGKTLVLWGESGTGKELAARHFHERGPHAKGPFVALNGASIPPGLAERLLFGTKRGAYSGADADAIGPLQAADGGVLFLDEVVELDLGAQAKLLRVLETGEVLPLGAHKPQRVDVRVCVATHQRLREAVAAGRFREDLLYRLAPPQVDLPPLRARRDEIAHHVADEIAKASSDLAAHASLVEACLVRHWPGNVRELRREVREAAATAKAAGSDRVRREHLSQTAGLELDADDDPGTDEPRGPKKRPYVRWSASITREQIEHALAENHGNVAGAARSLGMNRSQLYREMARCEVSSGSNQGGIR